VISRGSEYDHRRLAIKVDNSGKVKRRLEYLEGILLLAGALSPRRSSRGGGSTRKEKWEKGGTRAKGVSAKENLSDARGSAYIRIRKGHTKHKLTL